MKSIAFPLFVALGLTTVLSFTACGGSSSNDAAPRQDAGSGDDAGDDAAGDDAAGDDASPDAAPLDHGHPSTTYPAFKPDMPELQNNGGTVLSNPVFVTVTWDTDPLQAQLEAFDDAVPGSTYWSLSTKEYGVMGATSGTSNHVRIGGTVPSTFTEQSVADFIAQQAANAPGNGWVAPTDQTIYVVYLHPSTVLTRNGGNICQYAGGYHSSVNVNGRVVSYAMIPRCMTGNLLETATETASHELGEAATDPKPNVLPAYTGFDQSHVAWLFFHAYQPENGDACEFYLDSFYKDSALGFYVQRLWSNASAKAGKMPCQPARSGPYFNVTPTALEDVTADMSPAGFGILRTKGIRIPKGQTKTFPVGFYSDGPTGGAWSVRVAEAFYPSGLTGLHPPQNHLSVSIDKTSGQNGEIAYITVTTNTPGQQLVVPGVQLANFPKLNFVTVLSSLNGNTSYMPILIVTN